MARSTLSTKRTIFAWIRIRKPVWC